MNFNVTSSPNMEKDEYIKSKTREYNSLFVPNDFTPLSVYCHDNDGAVIGGLTGKTYWNYLDIEFLWVEEAVRNTGVASKILRLAECDAKIKGCHFSMLDTYEFQALGFYLKMGYEQFGKLSGYCEKYNRYYLMKEI